MTQLQTEMFTPAEAAGMQECDDARTLRRFVMGDSMKGFHLTFDTTIGEIWSRYAELTDRAHLWKAAIHNTLLYPLMARLRGTPKRGRAYLQVLRRTEYLDALADQPQAEIHGDFEIAVLNLRSEVCARWNSIPETEYVKESGLIVLTNWLTDSGIRDWYPEWTITQLANNALEEVREEEPEEIETALAGA